MRISIVASLCTLAAFLVAPTQLSATSVMSTADLTNAAGAASLMTKVKCSVVDGHVKCSKKNHESKNNDDNDHKDKPETNTAKLIKLQDTCHVFTPGMGGGGCATPLIRRCDKLKDADQVCCCYKVDDSQPAQ